MTDAAQIAADPLWLPHKADFAQSRLQFLRVPPEQFASQGFLADHAPQTEADSAWLSFAEVQAMRPRTGPLHFIFHTAFCRSTLLARAVNKADGVIGMSEPGILASLASGGEAAIPLFKPVLNLLSRPHGASSAVFVKPTNHSNMLMPALLNARPDAKAVLMSNTLPAFLNSVNRKGMMGRRWGRQLYLELQTYAGMDFGMDAREQFAMSDLQATGLAWFLNRRWFALHLGGQVRGVAPDRLRTLDSDAFNEARAQTFAALGNWTGVDALAGQADAMAKSDIFTSHAKLGGDYAAREASDASRSISAIVQEEIAQVEEWVGMIAKQAGITMTFDGKGALF